MKLAKVSTEQQQSINNTAKMKKVNNSEQIQSIYYVLMLC